MSLDEPEGEEMGASMSGSPGLGAEKKWKDSISERHVPGQRDRPIRTRGEAS
jgi:hypothetical protein